MSPLSNAFIKPELLSAPEKFYPLHAFVCESCFLVQLEEFESPDRIFSDYLYFSSYSDSWLSHAKRYCDSATTRFNLTKDSFVVEVASNDGYLLKNFVERGIPCLGIEPAANVAKVAQSKGVPTESVFFGEESARQIVSRHRKADLMIANNVLAHVPDINSFVAGFAIALTPSGSVTFEFPHLLQLIENNQFDTIYHEHFSYLSLLAVERIVSKHGLKVTEIENLPTHGGSLRVTACHAGAPNRPVHPSVLETREREKRAGLDRIETYTRFTESVLRTKRAFLSFLLQAQSEGKGVVAYGAAAKGNTLLNFCGVRGDLIQYVVDRNPHKQGTYLPGTRIPVFAPERIAETKPHYVVILPWNLRDEVSEQLSSIRSWGGHFVVPIPTLQVF
jgi:hypothetical protein